MTEGPTRTAGGAIVLLLAYLAFISLGLPDGLLGIGWPFAAKDFSISTGALGALTIPMTAAYLISSVSSGFIVARLGVGHLLAASTALAAAGLLAYAMSSGLPVMVLAAILSGFGAGAIDSGLNAHAAEAFSQRHMNWLHAAFGLGATLGPLVMTGALAVGLSWRWGFVIVGVAQTLLAVGFALTSGRWVRSLEKSDAAKSDAAKSLGEPRDSSWKVFTMPAMWWSIGAFALYTSAELAAGLWAFLLLTEGRGMSVSAAGLCVSGYWGSLFIGRVVVGWVGDRRTPAQILRMAAAGLVLGAVLIALPAPGWVAVVGLLILGFAAAPVFPSMTLTTSARVGSDHAERAIGIQIAAAATGAALFPAIIGVILARTTPNVLGLLLLALIIGSIGAYVFASGAGGTSGRGS